MWIFTVDGFYSAVEAPWDNKMLMVRGRDKRDMVKLCSRIKHDPRGIKHTPMRDYHYRVYLTKKVWAGYLAVSAEGIDYGNFKERALENASMEKYDKYHDVWSVMAGYLSGTTFYGGDLYGEGGDSVRDLRKGYFKGRGV